MRFEIEAAGRIRRVEIERQDKSYVVRVDGQPHAVDVARTGSSWSLLIGPAEAGPHNESDVGTGFSRPARSYEVAFVQRPGGEMLVYVDGHPVMTRRAGLIRSTGGASDARVGPRPIVAPMPGRILKVLVKTGDAVAARQGLVVVEAMKMENELRSPKAGTVTEVRVTEGMSVEANAVLIVVD